ncbi:MAG: hypothetical protein CMM47_00115 [Rhodospirillaceae bacterium]|nr:hypothetical protein [Rhodospirillaceae bacterium]
MSASDIAWKQLISAIHTSGCKVGIAITGGGTGAVGNLLGIPGGSQLLIEAQVPYSEQALSDFLGFRPSQACNIDVAITMAQRARSRALRLTNDQTNVIGLGVTAALVSDRPRRGEHSCHIAVTSENSLKYCSITLVKGKRSRTREEELVGQAIVLWLARACGVSAPTPDNLLDANEQFSWEKVCFVNDSLNAFFTGAVDQITALPDGQFLLSTPSPALILPGSFNPIHDGHKQLAVIASEIRGEPITFEISITNVDKPTLSEDQIRRRVQQFAWIAPVRLTRAQTFLEKSRLFPGATFVIGADTAQRLVTARYYCDNQDRMYAALEEIGRSCSSFLVAVRVNASGKLMTLRDIPIPRRFMPLFVEIPEEQFRLDKSSTELRRNSR